MTMGIPPEILRHTAYQYPGRLTEPMGSAEKRSPICGSRVIVDVNLNNEGRVSDIGMRVNACAFGQAAATVLAQSLANRTPAELSSLRDNIANWIAGNGDVPDWPGIWDLRPERLNSVRKASVQLAFQAAADAAEAAATAKAAR
ncbi:iron-sulfur cluster assembly scaffold protein [Sphingomonas ginsenosidivorax]|uniref:Iron-sulfur cluster assembly scaffold protein n=1 Tax=Sphingomonas ginsenosidivorax TaxID=862135 RepID=A0A5C6UH13_9SPHN|nr:iron-sulfur cluster assembly scaffold protein [Sphingomonas ginsenosidivorax]TXC71521.1 iron-sulfur cluster assembly scaffold protein [Sphingomonas ginsenosidivorax]